MIAFGCSTVSHETYERFALPGIRLAFEADSVDISRPARETVFESYNGLLDDARKIDDLEALVIPHQDLEITDPHFCEKVRRCFADEELAVLGVLGGRGVKSLAWWECDEMLVSFDWRYYEDGGGVVDQSSFENFVAVDDLGPHGVDTVDGMLLVLSPWTVRELRFDEGLAPGAHAYDLDLCFQAREAGRSVGVAGIAAVHHHEIEIVSDSEHWIDAAVKIARKWEGRIPGFGGRTELDWEQRGRLAEAETSAARQARNELGVTVNELRRRLTEAYAHAGELLEQLEQVEQSASWRLTEPLRRLGRRRDRDPRGR